MRQVHLDGAGGDEQPLGDGVVPQAFAHEADDLQFGGGEAGQPVAGRLRPPPLRAAKAAADLVGPGGFVVGVDRSPDALARARLRARQRGLAQVQFVEGDLDDPPPGGPFDAIVERLVLWMVPDPAALLRRQATVLRPGGLVVPIEADLSTLGWLPETPFAVQVKSWLVEAFAKPGCPWSARGCGPSSNRRDCARWG